MAYAHPRPVVDVDSVRASLLFIEVSSRILSFTVSDPRLS